MRDSTPEIYKYIGKNKTLNPKLWTKEKKLKEEVSEKIMESVEEFINLMKKDNITIEIKDIVIVGSNAGYTYNQNSDIDIHILVNYDLLNCDQNYLAILYSNYKKIFESKYCPIILGYEVEIYVENYNNISNISSNIYSILNEKWIKGPETTIPTINAKEINIKFKEWEDRIKNIKDELFNLGDIKDQIDLLENVINTIYSNRISSLKKYGEYGTDNIVFKELRAKGYITFLKNLKKSLINKKISLPLNAKDKLIQSSSKKALKKNIETEIASGKDPKQAAAIAYSIQRKNKGAK